MFITMSTTDIFLKEVIVISCADLHHWSNCKCRGQILPFQLLAIIMLNKCAFLRVHFCLSSSVKLLRQSASDNPPAKYHLNDVALCSPTLPGNLFGGHECILAVVAWLSSELLYNHRQLLSSILILSPIFPSLSSVCFLPLRELGKHSYFELKQLLSLKEFYHRKYLTLNYETRLV
jgi:hypothetical protein